VHMDRLEVTAVGTYGARRFVVTFAAIGPFVEVVTWVVTFGAACDYSGMGASSNESFVGVVGCVKVA
jgi:hypothetical protein